MVLFWIILLAAASCVPILEIDDVGTYINYKTPTNKYYEQDDEENDSNDYAGAFLGTNLEDGQMNKEEEFLQLLERLLQKTNGGDYARQYIHDAVKKPKYETEKITEFRNVIDELLESIDPSYSVVGRIEEQLEKQNDYDSILFDLIDSFTDKNSLSDLQSDTFEKGVYFKQRLAAIIQDKSMNEHDRESLVDVIDKANRERKRLLRGLKEEIGEQKMRTKRVTYDEGKVL